MLRLSCLFLLFAAAYAGVVKFNDCANHEVSEVRLNQCNSDPCVLHKGNDVHIEVDFTSNQDTNKAEIDIFAKLGEVEIQVPGIETNACQKGRLSCPLKKGEKYTLKYDIFIPKLVPSIKTEVTAKLIGDNGPLACGKVNGEIQD